MPDDLKKAIIEAIAASGDENYKRLLLLLLRVEEMFLDRVNDLTEQMTVPAKQHAEDHLWITSARRTQGGIRTVLFRVTLSVVEKGALVAAGAVTMKMFGV